MRPAALAGLAALCLAACASKPTQAPVFAEPAPGMAGVDDARASRAHQAPVLSSTVLPSIKLTATLTSEGALLQRPQRGSAVLRALPAGTVAELLGDLDNAEGQWLSVAIDGMQGWIPASQATR